MPENVIKGLRRGEESIYFYHAFIIYGLSIISCCWWFANKMGPSFLERTLFNHCPLLCSWLSMTSHAKCSRFAKTVSTPYRAVLGCSQHAWFNLSTEKQEILKWRSSEVPQKWLRFGSLLKVANPCIGIGVLAADLLHQSTRSYSSRRTLGRLELLQI